MKHFNIILFVFILISLDSCVEKRDLSQNTVIVHISSNPDGLHPFNSNSATGSFILQYTQKALLNIDLKSLKVEPILLKKLPIPSEDGLEYTYELIDGIKWDDGKPLTVDDVIFSIKLLMAPLTNNPHAKGSVSSVVKGVRKDIENPNKFILTCKQLHRSNSEAIAGAPIQQKSYWDPEGILDNYTFDQIEDINYQPSKKMEDWFNAFNNADNSYVPEKLVGLGPYQVTEFVPGGYVVLEKKGNWYGNHSTLLEDQNNPDKIIFKIIADEAAAYLAIKNQQVDVSTSLTTTKLMKLQELDYFNKNYHSDFLNQYSYSYIGLNMKPDGIEFKPYFTDQRVRRAMAHLVPVDEIIEVLVKGKAARQASCVSPFKPWYNNDLKLIEFNVEKAEKLLDEAGWKDTDGDNIRDKVINGEKIPFSFALSYISFPSTKEMVLMVKEAMYKAGIEVRPTPMDFSIFFKNAGNHKFDAQIAGWGGSITYSDPTQLWHTTSWANKGSNFTGFGNAESDSLIKLANTSLDNEKHYAAIRALQKKIYDEQPYVFLYSTKRKIVIHKRFDNANMYDERPGVAVSNLLLRPNFGSPTLNHE